MKRMIAGLLLAMLLPCISFAQNDFDKTIIEKSGLYNYNKFTKEWTVRGQWDKIYNGAVVSMSYLTSREYIESNSTPVLTVQSFNRVDNKYNTVNVFRAIVDGTLFSFAKLIKWENYSYAFGGNILREFANALKTAKEVAFQIECSDQYGASFTFTIDPVELSSLSELIEIANLLENSNAWDLFNDNALAAYDTVYGASKE